MGGGVGGIWATMWGERRGEKMGVGCYEAWGQPVWREERWGRGCKAGPAALGEGEGVTKTHTAAQLVA